MSTILTWIYGRVYRKLWQAAIGVIQSLLLSRREEKKKTRNRARSMQNKNHEKVVLIKL